MYTLSFILMVTSINAQIIQSRLLTVDQENMEEFFEGLHKKQKCTIVKRDKLDT